MKRFRVVILFAVTLALLAGILFWSRGTTRKGAATPAACLDNYYEACRSGDGTYLNCLAESYRSRIDPHAFERRGKTPGTSKIGSSSRGRPRRDPRVGWTWRKSGRRMSGDSAIIYNKPATAGSSRPSIRRAKFLPPLAMERPSATIPERTP